MAATRAVLTSSPTCRSGDGAARSNERLSGRIVYTGPLIPPVKQGDEVARLRIYRGQVLALDTPLKAAETIEKGTLRQQALDAGLEWFSGLIRKYVFKS